MTSAAFADGLGVPRPYPTTAEMVAAEAGQLGLVVVATPKDSHYEIAAAVLRAGIPVVFEKPLTGESSSAADLVRIADEQGVLLAVTHCYSAYAMVRQAARMVREGVLGTLRYVDVEHASGWAARPLEREQHRQPRGAPTRT